MAANNRNSARPAGRSPPFLAIGLTVALVILGFNYWSLSSTNGEQADEIAVLESEMRLINAKKLSAEKREEAMIDKIKDLEGELSNHKTVVADKMAQLSNLGAEKDNLLNDKEKCDTELNSCNNELLPACYKERDEQKQDLDQTKATLETLKNQPQESCDESKCALYSDYSREKLLSDLYSVLGIGPLVALHNKGISVGKYQSEALRAAAQGQDQQQQPLPYVPGGQPIVQSDSGGFLNQQQQQQQQQPQQPDQQQQQQPDQQQQQQQDQQQQQQDQQQQQQDQQQQQQDQQQQQQDQQQQQQGSDQQKLGFEQQPGAQPPEQGFPQVPNPNDAKAGEGFQLRDHADQNVDQDRIEADKNEWKNDDNRDAVDDDEKDDQDDKDNLNEAYDDKDDYGDDDDDDNADKDDWKDDTLRVDVGEKDDDGDDDYDGDYDEYDDDRDIDDLINDDNELGDLEQQDKDVDEMRAQLEKAAPQ